MSVAIRPTASTDRVRTVPRGSATPLRAAVTAQVGYEPNPRVNDLQPIRAFDLAAVRCPPRQFRVPLLDLLLRHGLSTSAPFVDRRQRQRQIVADPMSLPWRHSHSHRNKFPPSTSRTGVHHNVNRAPRQLNRVPGTPMRTRSLHDLGNGAPTPAPCRASAARSPGHPQVTRVTLRVWSNSLFSTPSRYADHSAFVKCRVTFALVVVGAVPGQLAQRRPRRLGCHRAPARPPRRACRRSAVRRWTCPRHPGRPG